MVKVQTQRADASPLFKESTAFSSFSVNDIAKAKEFYGKTLGVDVADGDMGTLMLKLADGNKILLYPKDDHKPASFTVLNFLVDDIDTAVDDITSRGIEMEQYGIPEMKQDDKGISRSPKGPKIAWFEDPFGNILSVLEDSK